MRFKTPDAPIVYILIFLLFVMGVGGSAFLYYNKQKEQAGKAAWEQLSAIADLKVNQLTAWRAERMGDARVAFDTPFVAELVGVYLTNPSRLAAKDEILAWMQSVQRNYTYEDVQLLDGGGELKLSAVSKERTTDPRIRQYALEAMGMKKIIFLDFHRRETIQGIHLGLVVPLTARRRDRPVGVLVFLIDPGRYLYPLIQSWPTPSATAETLLVRREGGHAVFLNDLRHRKDAALSLRLPVGEALLPAAMAVRGHTGVVEGVDYRGVPVLAAVRSIPDSPWFIVAKIDRDEIAAPVRKQVVLIVLVVGVLVIASAAGTGLVRHRQNARIYRDKYEMQKKTEEELRKLNDELELRVSERTKKLVTANRELEAFSYSVSHDLRAPLRSTTAFSQALLEDYSHVLDETGRDYLGRIAAAGKRMGQLIDDLLRLSRISRQEMEYRNVDLSLMTRDLSESLRKEAPERAVSVTAAPGMTVKGDPSLILIMMENLLNNAFKFTRNSHPARIEVGVAAKEGRLIYFVSDNGAGFAMAYADKLFAPFQRLHSLAEFEGTGVGLAIVQRILRRHGGDVWAEAEVGKGATFYFTLGSSDTAVPKT